jgi:hypothetical protein
VSIGVGMVVWVDKGGVEVEVEEEEEEAVVGVVG